MGSRIHAKIYSSFLCEVQPRKIVLQREEKKQHIQNLSFLLDLSFSGNLTFPSFHPPFTQVEVIDLQGRWSCCWKYLSPHWNSFEINFFMIIELKHFITFILAATRHGSFNHFPKNWNIYQLSCFPSCFSSACAFRWGSFFEFSSWCFQFSYPHSLKNLTF